MRVRLVAPPWGMPSLTEEANECIEILGENIWSNASVKFYAERSAKLKSGKSAPKGMQGTLNSIIAERFNEHDWIGKAGYFVKGNTWVRITFRHQMSLGSDIVDALKVCKKENIELAIILAAGKESLKIISPNDAAALISFEKLQAEIFSLNGALDIPLLIGELVPTSNASTQIDDELRKSRPRDITVPIK